MTEPSQQGGIVKRWLLTPQPMHSNLRLLDILVCLVVMAVGVGVRLVWNSDWALVAFPLAVLAGCWTRIHFPDAGAQSGRADG